MSSYSVRAVWSLWWSLWRLVVRGQQDLRTEWTSWPGLTVTLMGRSRSWVQLSSRLELAPLRTIARRRTEKIGRLAFQHRRVGRTLGLPQQPQHHQHLLYNNSSNSNNNVLALTDCVSCIDLNNDTLTDAWMVLTKLNSTNYKSFKIPERLLSREIWMSRQTFQT